MNKSSTARREAVTSIRNIETSSGGSRRIGQYLFVYGFTDQYSFNGPFGGRQCTSTALAALIFWGYRGRPHMFVPENVNEILTEGYFLHLRLRNEFKLSSASDNMVAIYDIPHAHYLELGEIFDMPVKIRLAQETFPVFTTRRPEFGFPTLGEFIVAYRPGMPMAFLLTISSFTYALIRSMSNSVMIYDSHGHLRVRGKPLGQRAGFLLCPRVIDLEMVIYGMYGPMAQCEIAPIDLGLPDEHIKRLEEPADAESRSPYVSLMGGWGD